MQIDFDQKPKEAIKYLKNKGYNLTFNYEEMLHEAHHKAFTVAKITKLDLLKDIHKSLDKARQSGIPFEQWKKEIVPTLQKKSWWGGQKLTDPKTGEKKDVYIGSNRLKTIFYTNARVSYNVGRATHQYSLPNAKYLRYIAILDSKTRKSHKKLHGLVMHRDSPFWKKNYPQNGWNCRCSTQAYSLEQVTERGWNIREYHKDIADDDWAYDTRKGSDTFNIYEQKIKTLPTSLKQVALKEKEVTKLILDSFEKAPLEMKEKILKSPPVVKIDPKMGLLGGFNPKTKEIKFKVPPAPFVVRHETGHFLDNISDNLALDKAFYATLVNNQIKLFKAKEKIEDILYSSELHDIADNVILHDIFFNLSRGKIGEPTKLYPPKRLAQEVFANLFEIYTSGNKKRLDIIKEYLPKIWEAFLKLLEKI